MSEFKVAQLHCPFKGKPGNDVLFVLLHGFGASSFSWRDLTGPLSELGEVWGYDRPGFGFTERPTEWAGSNPYSVAGNVEYLEYKIKQLAKGRKVIVIGHSAGGQIATFLAAENPELVSGLVLISPAMKPAGFPAAFSKLLNSSSLSKLGPKLAKKFEGIGMQILYKSVHDLKFLTAEVIAGYRKPLENQDWQVGFWQFLKTPQPRNQKSAIAKVNCPCLIITGDDDRIVPTRDTIAIAPLYANHRLIVIKNAGHISHEEKPSELLAEVNENLEWLIGE
jgi:pimeloyl-ACP methyl ester carboxylesterase